MKASPGCTLRKSFIGGLHRSGPGTYLLFGPERATAPLPLILLFHGFGSDAARFVTLTGLQTAGPAAGFLVAVPDTPGAVRGWQVNGRGTDAAFVDGVVAAVERDHCVDENAVFATGFSSGAAFTLAYGCAHQDRIAAIATVAVEYQLGCTKPLSILAFHGTADPAVPYQNGAIGLSLKGVKVRGTELNMADWARLDRCRATPQRARLSSEIVHETWNGCAPGIGVQLYSVLGGGHSWPGADPKRALGRTTQQIDATSLILDFFVARTR